MSYIYLLLLYNKIHFFNMDITVLNPVCLIPIVVKTRPDWEPVKAWIYGFMSRTEGLMSLTACLMNNIINIILPINWHNIII